MTLGTRVMTLGARVMALGARVMTLGARAVTLGARAVTLGARVMTLGARASVNAAERPGAASAQRHHGAARGARACSLGRLRLPPIEGSSMPDTPRTAAHLAAAFLAASGARAAPADLGGST